MASKVVMKKSKKVSKVKKYVKTDKKVSYKGKERTVYKRVKDDVECVRCKNKEGKVVYKKVSKLSGGKKVNKMMKRVVKKVKKSSKRMMNGGCGCGATSPSMMGGMSPEVKVMEESVEGVMEGGARRLNSNKKTELYKKARKYAVKGRSKMTKSELVKAVRAAHKALGDRLRRRGSKKQ